MLNAIIIDDEAAGRDELYRMLRTGVEGVKISGVAYSAKDGIRAINSYDPDLVFLDIEMPGENGFDMLAHFEKIDFEVIFVTAYDKYAIQAIKFSALDYLLKPVDENELRKAILKAKMKIESGSTQQKQYDHLLNSVRGTDKRPDTIALPNATGLSFVPLENIVRLESVDHKTHFHLTDKTKLCVNKSLKEFEELLGDRFFRVHHAHVVNLAHARKYLKGEGGDIVMSDGSTVEISRRKKAEFLSLLGM